VYTFVRCALCIEHVRARRANALASSDGRVLGQQNETPAHAIRERARKEIGERVPSSTSAFRQELVTDRV